jgi:hypothetical protein
MASFLLECLAFNVPNHILMEYNYVDAVKGAVVFLYNATAAYDNCSEWGEVNELKYLFRGVQPWTGQQVNAFTVAAWNHVGCG